MNQADHVFLLISFCYLEFAGVKIHFTKQMRQLFLLIILYEVKIFIFRSIWELIDPLVHSFKYFSPL